MEGRGEERWSRGEGRKKEEGELQRVIGGRKIARVGRRGEEKEG